MPKISKPEVATQRSYLQTKPKARGNLHQRMKFLEKCVKTLSAAVTNDKHPDICNLVHEVRVASMDLETEVAYHTPAKPPYGRRVHSYPVDWTPSD